MTIATPRDRDGTFEPQLIGKHLWRVPGFDEKILALYAKGMTRDIQDIVLELYGVDVSATEAHQADFFDARIVGDQALEGVKKHLSASGSPAGSASEEVAKIDTSALATRSCGPYE